MRTLIAPVSRQHPPGPVFPSAFPKPTMPPIPPLIKGSSPISGNSSRGCAGMSIQGPREGRGAGGERSLRSDHQKYGGATRSHISGKYPEKALFLDISQNRGLEFSAPILQVAPKSSLPADPELSRREESPGIGRRTLLNLPDKEGLNMDETKKGPSPAEPTWSRRKFLGAASTAAAGFCLLYTSPSPRDGLLSRMPSSA